MGKVKGKHRLDKYYRLAKEHGYRSRAAWKLVQIDAKFKLLASSRAVLDLCAAPGGWIQASVERVPVGSLVLGIDLVPIAPIRGAVSFVDDITKTECRTKIKRVMGEHGVKAFQLVLHDGSPNVGGAWAQEATSQNALVIDSVKLATQFLAPKGNFITKVFRSQDYANVIFCLKKLFDKVEVYKPPASRDTSAEIFVLGLKYKAPAKIDPHLLDMKHLFESSAEPKKVIDVLRGTKQKRHRDGYENGDTTLRKECSVADFVWSDKPLEILGSVTAMTFTDPACQTIKDNTLTTDEVKLLCDDLRVLGKNDFKHLLKWRMHIRKALSPTPVTAPSTPDAEGEGKEAKDEDEKLLDEMEELTNAMDRKKKREKKIIAKRRAKDKARKATGMQIDAMQDGYTDNELFSLASIKGKKDLIAVDSAEFDEEKGDTVVSDDEGDEDGEETVNSDLDSDEERQRFDEQMEDLLDQAYEQFMSKKGGAAKQRKRAKQAYSEDAKLLESGEDIASQSDPDSGDDAGDLEANPLLAGLDESETPTQEEVTLKWFSQDIFADAVKDGDLGVEMSDDEMQVDKQDQKVVAAPKRTDINSVAKKTNSITSRKDARLEKLNQSKTQDSKSELDFEIVPAPETDSSDSSDSDESEMDDNTKAEILAYGKKMLRKKQREQMMDDAYNKYMFHDDKNLPRWFVEEEKKHNVPVKPVTKEEVNAMKAQF
uniref:rRNA methyltransferase n=1 Tax=Kalanchoe fedtschenkoi TaxID=63787 RepID=A0A7N0SZQ7_KALFE